MSISNLVAELETAAELVGLDVATGNVTAFRADFNSFSEIVTSDGRVIRKIEQPGGATYSVVENVGMDGIDEFMNEAGGDWYDVEPEALFAWLINVEK